MSDHIVVYISAPLTDGGEADFDTIHANLSQVAGYLYEVSRRGFAPICTHAYYLLLRRFGFDTGETDRDLWLSLCETLISVSDVVLRIGGVSEGTIHEEMTALRLNKPIIYDIDELDKFKYNIN